MHDFYGDNLRDCIAYAIAGMSVGLAVACIVLVIGFRLLLWERSNLMNINERIRRALSLLQSQSTAKDATIADLTGQLATAQVNAVDQGTIDAVTAIEQAQTPPMEA